MVRVYLLDLALFVRKIALRIAVILLLLLGAAVLFYLDNTWPQASFLHCFLKAFYVMSVEPVDLPDRWYLELMALLLPLLALLVGAEAVVSAMVMFVNRSQRRGEWNRVVASTYRGHTVICGMGQFGVALCERLSVSGRQVVAVDLDDTARGMVAARGLGVPTIAGDMTAEDTLRAANVSGARYLVLCSGDDLANLEAAIEGRELNPQVVIYARVYKESLARRINEALHQNINIFSPYATAACTILQQMEASNHCDR